METQSRTDLVEQKPERTDHRHLAREKANTKFRLKKITRMVASKIRLYGQRRTLIPKPHAVRNGTVQSVELTTPAM